MVRSRSSGRSLGLAIPPRNGSRFSGGARSVAFSSTSIEHPPSPSSRARNRSTGPAPAIRTSCIRDGASDRSDRDGRPDLVGSRLTGAGNRFRPLGGRCLGHSCRLAVRLGTSGYADAGHSWIRLTPFLPGPAWQTCRTVRTWAEIEDSGPSFTARHLFHLIRLLLLLGLFPRWAQQQPGKE